MKIHLYMLCYRCEALVASHLEPEAFARYMAVGTQKNARGNVLIFEIDPGLKSDYFRLENLEERCAPHVDGTPKRSKRCEAHSRARAAASARSVTGCGPCK